MRRYNKCIVCGHNELTKVVDLGKIYPSAFISHPSETSKFETAELALNACRCGMVQLTESPECDEMYREYWYRSALNKSMVASLKDVYEDVIRHKANSSQTKCV